MRIYLIGMMGSGKSTAGKILAERLAVPFIDLDKTIEKNQGMQVKEIFCDHSEDFFRECEKNALQQVIVDYGEAVIATGGGTPCFHNGLSVMKGSGITVYLECAMQLLKERIHADKNVRPLVNGNDEALERIFQTRKNVYEAADILVNAAQDPLLVAEEILRKIKMRV